MEQLAVEDLSYGLNEWRNIQSVVRETFKIFHDVLKSNSEAIKSQAAAISRLEKALENKTNKNEIQSSLSLKANTTDIANLNRRLTDLNRVIDEKAERAEFSLELTKKANTSDVATRFAELITLMEDSNEEIRRDLDTRTEETKVFPKQHFFVT